MRQTKDKKRVISWVLILSIITANLNVPLMAAEQTQTYIADSGNENQVSENQTSENEIPDSALLENQISDNQVSENEISENEVSGNIISENAVSGNEIGVFDLTKAKQSLSEILNQKDIMALVYLTDSLDVRKEPASDSQSVKKVKSGQLVFIQDVAIGLDDGSIWYYVKIADTDIYGYLPRYYLACSDELLLEWEKEYMGELSTYENAVGGDTSEEIEAFPGSYRKKLYNLKSLHPNWVFVEYAPGIDWNTVIDKQYGKDNNGKYYSWIWDTAPSEYKEESIDTNWNHASKKGIAYYMDPRNFLNESNLFQFEQLTYNKDYHTEAAVKSLLSGSFMSGEIPRDDGESKIRTYANEFYSLGASETLKVSPFHLAARVFLEQGDGKSPLISGKYPGYENLYNYFNIGASGSGEAVIISGLTKARSYKWDRRYKSLAGGALSQGRIVATSTAAGPALEGMNIECGCRAQAGAIETFDIDEEYNISYNTIGNLEAIGICGSGLIDIAGGLVKMNILMKSGRWNKDLDNRIAYRLVDKKFYITDDIYISQKDIRQIQLAKGAIAAGIIVMLDEIGLNIGDVSKAYIAGAFGYHINGENIKNIGLIPRGFNGEIIFLGNTSLEGARLALINKECLQKTYAIKDNMLVLELSLRENFQEIFVNQLNF